MPRAALSKKIPVRTALIQYGAMPWRRAGKSIELLLITTRRTRRWIVPKGWPLPDLTPGECAAYEALEEAGVLGEVAIRPIGTFVYDKERKSGEIVPCKVEVYPLKVIRRRRRWAEKSARASTWCSVDEAAALVTDSGLRRLIMKFARMWRR